MNFTPVTFSLTVAAFLVPSGHSLHAVDPPQALVERYCLACHDADVKKGGLDLGSILDEDLSAHTAVWETVVRQLNTRQMPPVGKKRPGAEGYDGAVAELTAALDDLAERHPRPGRTLTLRRLTRVEYQNAVRDLLAVDLDASKLLPADEASHGFDNVTVGDLPPALLDRYLTAAQKIARLAVGASTESEIMAVRVRPDITQEYQVPGLPLGTRGGVLIPRVFAQSGDYEVQVRLQRDRNEQVEGMNGNHELQVLLDRDVMAQFTVQPAIDRVHGLRPVQTDNEYASATFKGYRLIVTEIHFSLPAEQIRFKRWHDLQR